MGFLFFACIQSSLNLPHYGEACKEWRASSPRLGGWTTQLRRNIAEVASRWRYLLTAFLHHNQIFDVIIKKSDCDVNYLIMMQKGLWAYAHLNWTCGQGK